MTSALVGAGLAHVSVRMRRGSMCTCHNLSFLFAFFYSLYIYEHLSWLYYCAKLTVHIFRSIMFSPRLKSGPPW